MTKPVTFTLDGQTIEAEAGQTILEAADAAGVYIPRLCHMPGLVPWGGCRV
jgi:[NiFe] hydrogenase diaphorase moiety small subunit